MNLRELEQKEKGTDKAVLEKQHRQAFVKLLENEIRSDHFTPKTLYSEYVKRLKDEEAFYNLIGQEPCNPRDLFLDYKEKLCEGKLKIKKLFIETLKSNIEDFPVKMNFEAFKKKLWESIKFIDFYESNICNSVDLIAKYLYKKLVKRQAKAISRLVRVFYNLDVNEKTKFADIKSDLEKHKFASHFESVSTEERIALLNSYKACVHDEELLLDFIESKIEMQKESKSKKTVPTLEEKPEKLKRRLSPDSSSDRTEQGEIKDYDLEKTAPKKIKHR